MLQKPRDSQSSSLDLSSFAPTDAPLLKHRNQYRQETVPFRSSLTWNVEISGLLQQKIQILEVLGNEQFRVSHKVENVSEHTSVPVYKIVLFQRVQDYWDAAVEKFC